MLHAQVKYVRNLTYLFQPRARSFLKPNQWQSRADAKLYLVRLYETLRGRGKTSVL